MLIGNKEEIERLIKENNLELGDTQIIDQQNQIRHLNMQKNYMN